VVVYKAAERMPHRRQSRRNLRPRAPLCVLGCVCLTHVTFEAVFVIQAQNWHVTSHTHYRNTIQSGIKETHLDYIERSRLNRRFITGTTAGAP